MNEYWPVEAVAAVATNCSDHVVSSGVAMNSSTRLPDRNYSPENEAYRYTASSVAGNYTIEVQDNEGRRATIEVIARSPLAVTPGELFLLPDETRELTVSGGYGEYTVTAGIGDVVPQSRGKIVYQAASQAERDEIVVTDRTGAMVRVEALISPAGFYATPGKSYIFPEESTHIRALGGTPPYQWKVAGSGSLSAANGQRVSFIASQSTGIADIVCTDNTGLEAKSTVIVYQAALRAAPEILYLLPGATAEIHALFGIPDYSWSVGHGTLQALTGDTTQYTAPRYAAEDSIRLEDATGQMLSIPLFIAGSESPDIADIYAGSDKTLDETEMNRALADYFLKDAWLSREELYLLTERFLLDFNTEAQ
ncbi:MAG: hypothetical protein GY862_23630, partial [Gammaproteobacteria bacterium]|nr:hypothetical protein [Gammaproteobacteria bacterium]